MADKKCGEPCEVQVSRGFFGSTQTTTMPCTKSKGHWSGHDPLANKGGGAGQQQESSFWDKLWN